MKRMVRVPWLTIAWLTIAHTGGRFEDIVGTNRFKAAKDLLESTFYNNEQVANQKLKTQSKKVKDLGNYYNQTMWYLSSWKSDGRYECQCSNCKSSFPTVALRVTPKTATGAVFMKVVILTGPHCECSGGWDGVFEKLHPEDEEHRTGKQPASCIIELNLSVQVLKMAAKWRSR